MFLLFKLCDKLQLKIFTLLVIIGFISKIKIFVVFLTIYIFQRFCNKHWSSYKQLSLLLNSRECESLEFKRLKTKDWAIILSFSFLIIKNSIISKQLSLKTFYYRFYGRSLQVLFQSSVCLSTNILTNC